MSNNVIHKLTVYKIKQVDTDTTEIPGYSVVSSGMRKVKNKKYPYRLFFHKGEPNEASWVPVFRSLRLSLDDTEIPQIMVSGFILLVQIGRSIYGVTGGIGHIHLRKNLQIEPRFGIEVSQRILTKAAELRGLAQRDTSGVVHTYDRIFRGIYDPKGDIDNHKRVLTHLRGTLLETNPLQQKIGKSIQASDALTVNGTKDFNDIITFLMEVNKLLTSKKKFDIPGLEQIDRKVNPALQVQLEECLVDALSEYDVDNYALFLDSADSGYLPDRVTEYELKYQGNVSPVDTYQEVFQKVRDILRNLRINERVEAFRNMGLTIRLDGGSTTDSGPLSRFICGDIEHQNNVYFLNNNWLWYKPSKEFISTISNELDNIEYIDPASIGLGPWPDDQDINEDQYNRSHANLLVMHCHDVDLPGYKGPIEFCDLLKKSNRTVHLIHVKKVKGAGLRALFAQGYVSAQLYAESQEFREKVHTADVRDADPKLTAGEKRTLSALSKLHPREIKIVFAICDHSQAHKVTHGANTTLKVLGKTLSTFARVDLWGRISYFRLKGYGVALTRIKPYPTETRQ